MCLQELRENDEVTRLLCCHSFHERCIQHMASDHRNIRCPVCRMDRNDADNAMVKIALAASLRDAGPSTGGMGGTPGTPSVELTPRRVRVLIYCQNLRQVLVVHASTRATSAATTGPSWWSPGGGVHSRESHEQAAVREVREETGLKLLTHRLEPLGVIGHNGGQLYFCYDFGPSFPGPIRTVFWQRQYRTGWREVDDVWWGSWEEAVNYDDLHEGTRRALQWLAEIRGWTQ